MCLQNWHILFSIIYHLPFNGGHIPVFGGRVGNAVGPVGELGVGVFNAGGLCRPLPPIRNNKDFRFIVL